LNEVNLGASASANEHAPFSSDTTIGRALAFPEQVPQIEWPDNRLGGIPMVPERLIAAPAPRDIDPHEHSS